jgi:hypothetical protein
MKVLLTWINSNSTSLVTLRNLRARNKLHAEAAAVSFLVGSQRAAVDEAEPSEP